MSSSTYPVRVDARLDDQLSRWLWLVKWLLAIPHFIVLAFLWVAFLVLSVIALVAILFTGRYPRAIFDFNVGVLRWTWRVMYYTYGGLGTDHYPPFSLEERPDYPAHLEVAYPERLSRGLVLVKWWLLAIPHYLVLTLFVGGGWYAASGDDRSRQWGGGLIGLLVLIAAVVLLFTGRYPRSIFDLVLGLNRWALRVAAYVSLMTDVYPPFRLDMGGSDPGTGVLALGTPPVETTTPAPTGPPPTGPPPTAQGPSGGGPPTPPPPASRWGAGRIVAVVIGSMMAMTSLGLLAGGLALKVGDSLLRDDAGYLMSPTERYDSAGLAVTSDNIDLQGGSADLDLASRWLGTVKVEATSRTPGGIFVGIARTSDVDAYLRGVAHTTVTDPSGDHGDPDTTYVNGSRPALQPADESFWVTSSEGTGRQVVTWDPDDGDWTIVVMNADGSAPVRADVAAGAEVPILDDVAFGLLVAGLVLLALTVLVLVLAIRRPADADD
ncbi:MAG: DUF4389 domain-containing protein [Nocardioides sp.]